MGSLGSTIRRTRNQLVSAGKEWSDDRAIRLGAGLAYYSLFALIPILGLAISTASLFFGQEVASGALYDTIAEFLGEDLAELILAAIERTRSDSAASVLPIVSVGALIFTGTLLFVAWREIVDLMWDRPHLSGVRATVRRRMFGVAAVLGASLLLTVVLFAEAVVGIFASRLDIDVLDRLLAITGSMIPASIGAAFIAALFKYTPGDDLPWRTVWPPAILSMAALSIGAWAYGIYINLAGFRSPVGVAGTVFLGLVFVYYSAQLLLYGMELVKVRWEAETPSGG